MISKCRELFTVRPYRTKYLRPYIKRYSQDNDKVLVDDNVKTMLQAQGYCTDDAPRSVYTVSKLYEALSRYAPCNSKFLTEDQDVSRGIALAYRCFARPKDVPYIRGWVLNLNTVGWMTSNPTGSPGLTNFGHRKQDSMEIGLEHALRILRKEKVPEPCLAFKRTQFGGKTRLVWGYPYSMTILEGIVARPLIEHFLQVKSIPMAFGQKTGVLGTRLIRASYRKEWAYSIDMSSFDASISARLIRIAFSILKTWFDLKAVEPNSGATVKEIFDCVENYFIHTPIVMPDGNLYLGKRHGVPSGSYFTQMIDSVVNTIVAGTLSSKFHLDIDRQELFVLGDDLLMWSNRDVSLDDMAAYANSKLHVKMHGSEKSGKYHYDETIHFLGRDWTRGIPDLSQDEILKRMIFPESFRKYPADPDERMRSVRLLILSYAAVYWSGWDIARKTLGYQRWDRTQPGLIDNDIYRAGGLEELITDKYASGFQRYRDKYIIKKKPGYTTTASLFWM